MKKLLITLLILMPAFLFWSCKRNFLESTSRDGTMTDEIAFLTKAGYESYLFGAYSVMQGSSEGHGALQWVVVPGFISQDLLPVDELGKVLPSYLTPGMDVFQNHWGTFYKMIARTNLILDKLPTAPETISEADKTIIEGEAKFIRAFSYFNLARAYGNVPLMLTIYSQDQKALECTPEDQIWDQVISDLNDAAAKLPKRSEWSEANLGRATKGAALAYLANAYMYKKDWTSAKKATEDLMALGEYRLLDNVREVFSKINENTEESIFEVQYRDVEDGDILWSGQPEHGTTAAEYTSPRNIGDTWAPFGGWGEVIMNKKLADSYDPTDDRRKNLLVTVGDTYQGEAMTAPLTVPADIAQKNSAFSTKYWHGPETRYYSGQNLIQMRYAEVLLNYAEILFELGMHSEAYDQLNLVRNRAKVADKAMSADRETFITDLMKERRWELNFEPNLWFHYTRLDRAGAFLTNEYGITFNTAWNKFPIPQGDRDLNPKLCQNPGY
jgi:tetratricopeptide (TPR) repeat protein